MYTTTKYTPFGIPGLKVTGSEPDEHQLWGKSGFIYADSKDKFIAVMKKGFYREVDYKFPFTKRQLTGVMELLEIPKSIGTQLKYAKGANTAKTT